MLSGVIILMVQAGSGWSGETHQQKQQSTVLSLSNNEEVFTDQRLKGCPQHLEICKQ